MFYYKIESYVLHNQNSTTHEEWIEDDEIPDDIRSVQLWSHARPGKPAVIWIRNEDQDPEPVPIHIAGYGSDATILASMLDAGANWR